MELRTPGALPDFHGQNGSEMVRSWRKWAWTSACRWSGTWREGEGGGGGEKASLWSLVGLVMRRRRIAGLVLASGRRMKILTRFLSDVVFSLVVLMEAACLLVWSLSLAVLFTLRSGFAGRSVVRCLCCDMNVGGKVSAVEDVWNARNEELQGYGARPTEGPSTIHITISCNTFEKLIIRIAMSPKSYLHLYTTPRLSL
jgi:hypothetical protein